MDSFDNLENKYYTGLCKLTKEEKHIAKKNPHCVEFFCNMKNIFNCTKCSKYLVKNNLYKLNPLYKPHEKNIAYNTINNSNANENECKKKCTDGYIYPMIISNNDLKNNTIYDIDKYKILENFYQKKLIHKYDDIPYHVNYQSTSPKPHTVLHWGQLKMCLVLLMFLTKVVTIEYNYNIIYPGSAGGDNILILIKMFPNVTWYLIDPAPFHKDLYKNPKVKEIRNEFFTDKLAEYYSELFLTRKDNEKILFISDIRVATSDEDIIRDNNDDANWHTIIKPDFSYLKFRCPYDNPQEYEFYDGKIYIQPYAPISSTESRLFCTTNLIKKTYNIMEYQGKFVYFNRVIRPAYYSKSIIKENDTFDHCYDCTYFSYLIKSYIKKYPNNIFGTDDILTIMHIIINDLIKSTKNRIKIHNENIRYNIK